MDGATPEGIRSAFANAQCVIAVSNEIKKLDNLTAIVDAIPTKTKMLLVTDSAIGSVRAATMLKTDYPILFLSNEGKIKAVANYAKFNLKFFSPLGNSPTPRLSTTICPQFGRSISNETESYSPQLCLGNRQLLQGRHLTASYIPGNQPYVIRGRPRDGVDGKIMALLAAKFGFTFSLTPDIPFDWITTANGTSKGVIYKVKSCIR